MRILFVTPYVPSLVRIRPFNFIKYLAKDHQVTVLSLHRNEREKEHISILQPCCERIETIHLPAWHSLLNCLRALPTATPLQAVYSYSRPFQQRLRQLLAQSHYDLVHVEHLRGAYVVRSLTDVPCVYDSVDCISLLLERVLQNNESPLQRLVAGLELPRTRRYEATMLRSFDQILVSSDDDRVALERLCPPSESPRISVLSNGVHLAYPADDVHQQEADNIVFSGKMSYHPNVDAVRYFCRDILPVVKAMRPGVTFDVVGSNPTREVQALARDGFIRVIGQVPDVRPYLRRATVAVVPVRYAVGIQNKVLEAMAMGTPVVASPVASRALTARHGEDFLVAGNPTEFVGQIIRLLDDVGLRERIGSNGRHYVEKNHEWSSIANRLGEIYQGVLAEARRTQVASALIRREAHAG